MDITVVTRTHNRPELLKRARESLCQLNPGPYTLRWSLVNDAGDPEGPDLEANLARRSGLETIVSHLTQRHDRAGAANVGVEAVKSDAFILLDDDDRLLPNSLSDLSSYLSRSADIGVSGLAWQVKEQFVKGKWEEISRTITNPAPGPIRIIDLAHRNFIPVNSCLIRTDIFNTLKGFDPNLPVMEDWDFFLRALLIGDIGKIDKEVCEYFVRPKITNYADSLANSVEAGHGIHQEWEIKLRNKHLREDINNNRVGLGLLMNPPHRIPMERINLITNKLKRIYRFFGK